MKKVYVIGDSCTDEFVYGQCTRINPEAPTPVFVPNGQVKTNNGMAGNVFANIKSLRSNWNVVLVKPVGIDIVKRRYVDKKSNYIILRADYEPKIPEHSKFNSSEFIKSLNGVIPAAIVISDYSKGFLTEQEINLLCIWCRNNKIKTFLDTKKKINDKWANNIDFIKINELEFNLSSNEKGLCSGFIGHSTETCLIKTLGDKGCEIVSLNGNFVNRFVPTNQIEVRDVSGAGDTFLAAFAVSIVENKFSDDLVRYCEYANKAAGYACTQPGVVTVNELDFL